MTAKTTTLPAVAICSVGTGLLMMTVFTGLWTGIAYGVGVSGTPYQRLLLIFIVCMILLAAGRSGFSALPEAGKNFYVVFP
jgi:hypothetical protein